MISVASAAITPVFSRGESGYSAFRIPGIVAAQNNSLVVVAEGRKFGCDDFYGQHDVVSKTSFDGGATWGPLVVVADPVRDFGCANASMPASGRCQFWDPTPVYDAKHKQLLLMVAYASTDDHSGRLQGKQDVLVYRTHDAGLTWAFKSNVSSVAGPPPRVSPANGHGVQLVPSGRLLVPAYGGAGTHLPASYTYYSDDGGVCRPRCRSAPVRLSPSFPRSPGPPRGSPSTSESRTPRCLGVVATRTAVRRASRTTAASRGASPERSRRCLTPRARVASHRVLPMASSGLPTTRPRPIGRT